MIGHDPGKVGSWYEEGYVVLQLLRLLSEEVESVTWESPYEDEDGQGIDCWLREDGKRVAIQCKTRSRGAWTLGALKKPGRSGRSVLAYAQQQLERDATCRYRFVTDAPCSALEVLVDRARVTASSDSWWGATEEQGELLRAWQLESSSARDRTIAHNLLGRMSVDRAGSTFIDAYQRTASRRRSDRCWPSCPTSTTRRSASANIR